MGLVDGIIEWSKNTFLPYGELGLFIIAFAESSFSPIPPDIILITLSLLNPSLSLYFAFISTMGSVLGAMVGYFIGLKGGRPILLKLISERKIQKIENYFSKYGVWAIGVAGFTPIPYKIFTITSGIMRFNIEKFLVVSFISRGGRFFLEGIVLMVWGEQILSFLTKYFEILSISIVICVVGIYISYIKFFKRTSMRSG